MPSKLIRALVSTAAAVAIAGAIAVAPAHAAGATVLVDGVKTDASTLKGKKLFVVDAEAGKPAIAFSHKAAFDVYVRKHLGIDLSKRGLEAAKGKAKASWAGDYATFYADHNGYGDNFNVNSGSSFSPLYSVNCFLWWCTNMDDRISSVNTHGVPAMLYSETGFRGGAYFIGANQHAEIPAWFDNVTSSVLVYWS